MTCGYCYSPASKAMGKEKARAEDGYSSETVGTDTGTCLRQLRHWRIVAPRREAAAKPCAVPDLRQQLPLVIQRQEPRRSCQSSSKGSRARRGRWDSVGAVTTADPQRAALMRQTQRGTCGNRHPVETSTNPGLRLTVLGSRYCSHKAARHTSLPSTQPRCDKNTTVSWLVREETLPLHLGIKSKDRSVIPWLYQSQPCSWN